MMRPPAMLLLLVAFAAPAHADDSSPLLHEYIEPDAKDDIDMAATTPSGDLPAAVHTPSGTIRPPDVRTTPEPRNLYHQSTAADAFRPDRDTRRPKVESYDDPFSPTLTPFKRMHAFDAVRDDYSLYVRDKQLAPLPVGGEAAANDDRFFGDMMVQLVAGQDVRVPTVGPGARLLSVVTSPKTELSFWHDGAGNWFARGASSARVRLVTELSIARSAFSTEYADSSWRSLPPVPVQPARHRQAYAKVAAAIGLSRALRPKEAVEKMVAYFRSFGPSTDAPSEHGDIYLDLALSKKGVCRHRAFAFLVTSLNLGIPARMVHNEAHAWVEVRDHREWHRIDLGGAALDLADEPHLDRPPHQPPPDSLPWPGSRDSGSDLAHRRRTEAVEQAAKDRARDASSDPSAAEPAASTSAQPAASAAPADPDAPALPQTSLTIDSIDHDLFRGLPLRLKGRAVAEGKGCARLRVDVVVLIDGERERTIGSLSTDESGVYRGAVVLPRDLPIGDHDLFVITAGGKRCGPGTAN